MSEAIELIYKMITGTLSEQLVGSGSSPAGDAIPKKPLSLHLQSLRLP